MDLKFKSIFGEAYDPEQHQLEWLFKHCKSYMQLSVFSDTIINKLKPSEMLSFIESVLDRITEDQEWMATVFVKPIEELIQTMKDDFNEQLLEVWLERDIYSKSLISKWNQMLIPTIPKGIQKPITDLQKKQYRSLIQKPFHNQPASFMLIVTPPDDTYHSLPTKKLENLSLESLILDGDVEMALENFDHEIMELETIEIVEEIPPHELGWSKGFKRGIRELYWKSTNPISNSISTINQNIPSHTKPIPPREPTEKKRQLEIIDHSMVEVPTRNRQKKVRNDNPFVQPEGFEF